MPKFQVFRLRNLDRELAEMLAEADGRCSTAFALRLDDLREKLSPSLEAISKNQARIGRRHCDKDGKGNPKPDEKTGDLKFSTTEQQEKLNDEVSELLRSEIDIADDLPRLRKSELVANGLATSGQRIANLRPILDTSLDEPEVRDAGGERASFMITPPKRIPDA